VSWKHSVWRGVAAMRELTLGPMGPLPGLRVLGYHAVGTAIPGDPYGLTCAPESFARQMELLASGRFGRPVSLGGARIDGTAAEIAVTFDDGYRDTLTVAAPVLARLGIPFTVCVTPGLLDSGRPHLTWLELQELARVPGCEVGAHGLTHSRLDTLDDTSLAVELAMSRRRLEAAVGGSVKVMTWPHGAASRRTSAAARAAGFVRGGCSVYGLNGPERDALLLRRTEITGFDDDRDFVRKASGGWDWFARRQPDPARR
jgi:peptidoglycan/xylan/chitin deacetylase (PgdA/CDA1 family)